jgi:asparagine synthase (glutamine-hydrolysing)
MFLFRVAVSFGSHASEANGTAETLGAWTVEPPDGVSTAHTQHATAGIARWAVVQADREVVPIHHRDSGILIAGDVRLHNRSELKAILEVSSTEQISDLEIVRRAFLRWSEDTPRHLVGNFAFAVWDERARRLFAARDHLGIRPLCYRRRRDEMFLASDVRQLFTTVPDIGHRLDLDRLRDRFTHRYRQHGHTYFRDIAVVRPGHALIATAEGLRETRYWLPPLNGGEALTYDQNCERMRSIFRRSVLDCIESDRPIIAHSSGGFDSTTIVMAINEIYQTTTARAPVILASALTPGAECDDGKYIDAVSRQTSFESVQWDALGHQPSQSFDLSLASPVFRSGPGGGPPVDFNLAQERGARVLVGGFGGDEVKLAGGVFRDLVRNLRWGEIARDPAFRRSLSLSWRTIPRAALGFVSPERAVQFLAWFGTRTRVPPAWVGPELRANWRPSTEDLELSDLPWRSHVACDLWSRITRPQVSCLIDSLVLRATNEGLEYRLPYLDPRLIEHLLSVPWDQRFPHVDPRRMARDSLGTLMPRELFHRKGQGSWQAIWAQNCRAMLPATKTLLESESWHSAPYIDLGAARQLVDRVGSLGNAGDPADAIEAANIGAFETWLRAILGYARHPR